MSFEHVSFAYRQEEAVAQALVLRDVDLRIGQGELVAIVGHNGSGKSTLAKLTNGILTPTEGTVTVTGIDTTDEARLLDIRQTVGMVFQNPDNQIVATLVEEDVAFALENLGVESSEIRRRVDWALETVGMSAYARHAPHKLSGGQKQRVAIAGVIAMRPRCIVFDEPTAMLDPVGRAEVMKTIAQLHREHNITVILITHHMNEAALCGRIVVMNEGKVLLDDKPAEIFKAYDQLHEVGLSVPQTVELTHRLGLGGAPALSVEECASALYSWVMEAGQLA